MAILTCGWCGGVQALMARFEHEASPKLRHQIYRTLVDLTEAFNLGEGADTAAMNLILMGLQVCTPTTTTPTLESSA